MVTYKEMMVQEIIDDAALSTEQKVKKLREIDSDARALQRASSESAMNAHFLDSRQPKRTGRGGTSPFWSTDKQEMLAAISKAVQRFPVT